MDTFTDSYVACALWSSTDDAGNPLDDNYGAGDIAPTTLAKMKEDCADFQAANSVDLAELTLEQAGHDFWLTRNGHGAGFWDRGLGELGDRLTKASKVYGSFDLYVGDDGLIHG